MDERCDYCKENMGEIRLTSRHAVCSKCFEKIAKDSQKSHNMRLENNGIVGGGS